MNKLKNWEIGYIAGMIDGEGCLDVHSNGQPRLRISNTNKEVLEKIRKMVGGGNIYIANKKKKQNWRTRYEYYLGVRGGLGDLLKRVRKYLIVKRGDADKVLKLCENRPICERDSNGKFLCWKHGKNGSKPGTP